MIYIYMCFQSCYSLWSVCTHDSKVQSANVLDMWWYLQSNISASVVHSSRAFGLGNWCWDSADRMAEGAAEHIDSWEEPSIGDASWKQRHSKRDGSWVKLLDVPLLLNWAQFFATSSSCQTGCCRCCGSSRNKSVARMERFLSIYRCALLQASPRPPPPTIGLYFLAGNVAHFFRICEGDLKL